MNNHIAPVHSESQHSASLFTVIAFQSKVRPRTGHESPGAE